MFFLLAFKRYVLLVPPDIFHFPLQAVFIRPQASLIGLFAYSKCIATFCSENNTSRQNNTLFKNT